MLSTGIFLKIKFSKFLQTHFTSPIPIRMKKKMPYRVYFVMDYKKMPFRSTNFITLHGLLFIYDFRWNIDEINGFLKVWPFMAFYGLHWPFWPLWPWMNFLSKNWPLQIKI